MGRIVERSMQLLEEKGPLAFGFYTSGQLFLEDYYTLGVYLLCPCSLLLSHLPVIGGVGGRCVPPPCNSFQRFALGPGSSSTLLRRFERGRTEDLYDVGVALRSRPQAIQVRWSLRVGLVSRRFACIPVKGLAASRGLQVRELARSLR